MTPFQSYSRLSATAFLGCCLCVRLAASNPQGGEDVPDHPDVVPDIVVPVAPQVDLVAFYMAMADFTSSSQQNAQLSHAKNVAAVAAEQAGVNFGTQNQATPEAAAAFAAYQAAKTAFQAAFLAHLVAMAAPLADAVTLASMVATYGF
jgi:hypothetical protein